MDVYDVIQNVLVEELGFEAAEVLPTKHIKDDLELDSTETVTIALALKKHFSIDYVFPASDVTLEEIAKTVADKITEKA